MYIYIYSIDIYIQNIRDEQDETIFKLVRIQRLFNQG